MKHHHHNGLLLLALVVLVLWYVYRSHVGTSATISKAGVTGGSTAGTATAGGTGAGRSSSVVATFGLPAWKLNQSPLKYNEFQPDYEHSLDFYTQMYFPFEVDSATGVGIRGGVGSIPRDRFWSVTDNQQLVRA